MTYEAEIGYRVGLSESKIDLVNKKLAEICRKEKRSEAFMRVYNSIDFSKKYEIGTPELVISFFKAKHLIQLGIIPPGYERG